MFTPPPWETQAGEYEVIIDLHFPPAILGLGDGGWVFKWLVYYAVMFMLFMSLMAVVEDAQEKSGDDTFRYVHVDTEHKRIMLLYHYVDCVMSLYHFSPA